MFRRTLHKRAAPTVSIVIPAFNATSTIVETLESVFHRGFENCLALVIDDGSEDKTAELIKEFAATESNIRLIEAPHAGLSSARNLGLDYVDSEFLIFLDADDLIESEIVKKLVETAAAENLDILCFDTEPFSELGLFDEAFMAGRKTYYKRHLDSSVRTISGKKLLRQFVAANSYLPSACLYLVRTEFLREAKIRFINGLFFEDHPFTLEVLLRSKRARYINMVAHRRRMRPESITNAMGLEVQRSNLVSSLQATRRVANSFANPQTRGATKKILLRLERRIARLVGNP